MRIPLAEAFTTLWFANGVLLTFIAAVVLLALLISGVRVSTRIGTHQFSIYGYAIGSVLVPVIAFVLWYPKLTRGLGVMVDKLNQGDHEYFERMRF